MAITAAFTTWQDMENNQQKWVYISFVAASVLLAVVLYVLSTKFSVDFDFDARVRNLDKVLLVASAVVGVFLFIGLSKSSVANNFMNETVAELSKVTWPGQDETMKATVAVLIAVTIAGFVLSVVDKAWVALIGFILSWAS